MPTTIQQAVSEYLHAKRGVVSAKTFRWYQQKLAAFVTWCEGQSLANLHQVRASEIRDYLHSLTIGNASLSSYTRKGHHQVITGFIRWCSKEEILEAETSAKIADRIEAPKVEKTVIEPFSSAEIQALLHACEKKPTRALQARAKAIVYLLLDTGIRASELAFDSSRPEETTGLRMHQVFLDPGDPFIRVMGKGRKERDVPLGQKSRTYLRQYIHRYRGSSESPYVFLSRTGEPLTVRGLEEMVKRLGENARVSNCFVHRFRHTYAHHYQIARQDIYELSHTLGHTSVKVTENYLQKLQQFGNRNGHYSVGDNL